MRFYGAIFGAIFSDLPRGFVGRKGSSVMEQLQPHIDAKGGYMKAKIKSYFIHFTTFLQQNKQKKLRKLTINV